MTDEAEYAVGGMIAFPGVFVLCWTVDGLSPSRNRKVQLFRKWEKDQRFLRHGLPLRVLYYSAATVS